MWKDKVCGASVDKVRLPHFSIGQKLDNLWFDINALWFYWRA